MANRTTGPEHHRSPGGSMGRRSAVRQLVVAGFWVPLALCTWLALTPNPEDVVGSWSDIVLHLAAFIYLTVALFAAHFDPTSPAAANGRPQRQLSVWPAVLMLAYGLGLEVAQSFTGERAAEVKDLAVDAAGIGAAYVVVAAAVHVRTAWLGRAG